MGPQTGTGQAHGLPGFSDPGLLAALEAASPADLDALDVGVIVMDRAGVVLEYNHDESERSALPRSEVVGRNFFVVVGPCTNNLLVAGRFRRAASEQLDLDEEIDYVFTFRLRPVPVRLRMLAGRQASRQFLIVRTR